MSMFRAISSRALVVCGQPRRLLALQMGKKIAADRMYICLLQSVILLAGGNRKDVHLAVVW